MFILKVILIKKNKNLHFENFSYLIEYLVNWNILEGIHLISTYYFHIYQ